LINSAATIWKQNPLRLDTDGLGLRPALPRRVGRRRKAVDGRKEGSSTLLIEQPFVQRLVAKEGASLTDVPVSLEDSGKSKEVLRAAHPVPRATNLGDRLFDGLTTAVALIILLALAAMVGTLIYNSHQAISKFGFRFITTSTWDPVRDVFGALPAIMGTVYSSLLALLLAAPIGVLVAVFLVEMAPRRLSFGLGFLIELLSAVPSIVYGLWALFILVPLVRQSIQPFAVQHFGNTPLFSGYPIGLGMLPAALILAVMILPTIVALSRDVVQAVPNHQREAMLALGATRWETTWKVVVPYARSGIIGAIMLGLARAVGETMAVQMVIGNTQAISLSLNNLATTMPATIVNQFSEASPGSVYISALVEIALVLMIVTVLLNAAARLLVWGVTRKYQL
jgi:phosphate transport system permease protein